GGREPRVRRGSNTRSGSITKHRAQATASQIRSGYDLDTWSRRAIGSRAEEAAERTGTCPANDATSRVTRSGSGESASVGSLMCSEAAPVTWEGGRLTGRRPRHHHSPRPASEAWVATAVASSTNDTDTSLSTSNPSPP